MMKIISRLFLAGAFLIVATLANSQEVRKTDIEGVWELTRVGPMSLNDLGEGAFIVQNQRVRFKPDGTMNLATTDSVSSDPAFSFYWVQKGKLYFKKGDAYENGIELQMPDRHTLIWNDRTQRLVFTRVSEKPGMGEPWELKSVLFVMTGKDAPASDTVTPAAPPSDSLPPSKRILGAWELVSYKPDLYSGAISPYSNPTFNTVTVFTPEKRYFYAWDKDFNLKEQSSFGYSISGSTIAMQMPNGQTTEQKFEWNKWGQMVLKSRFGVGIYRYVGERLPSEKDIPVKLVTPFQPPKNKN